MVNRAYLTQTPTIRLVKSLAIHGNTITNHVCADHNDLSTGNINVNAANPTTLLTNQDPLPALSFTSDKQVLKISNGSVTRIAGGGGTQAGIFWEESAPGDVGYPAGAVDYTLFQKHEQFKTPNSFWYIHYF